MDERSLGGVSWLIFIAWGYMGVFFGWWCCLRFEICFLCRRFRAVRGVVDVLQVDRRCSSQGL